MAASMYVSSAVESIADQLVTAPYAFYDSIQEAFLFLTRRGTKIFPLSEADSLAALSFCRCKKVSTELRCSLEDKSIELLQPIVSSKDSLTLVSVGPGGCYQELVYLARLSRLCTSIQVVLIDTVRVPSQALAEICDTQLTSQITVHEQFFSVDSYLETAAQVEALRPDLLLLIDLTDDRYKRGGLALPDASFTKLRDAECLALGTVIVHTEFKKGTCYRYGGEEHLSEIK